MIKQDRIKVLKFKAELGFKTTEQRSHIMRQIRSSNTKPEIALRKTLWHQGFRYRINVKKLPGSPDISLPKYKLVIFVDGEFWHGYNWEIKKDKIKTNREFWIPKIERNIQRDAENNDTLRNQGWTVKRFWEHQVKKDLDGCVQEVLGHVRH